ncbi:DNA primase catalytic core, N-terminal domain [Proteiniborus ethanoligenes]|uniref:DNA primase catalytic core, N-terminal domain n=1 Tax=Proteiniborus ethanoligenes TaxID=415015 RepID=A0A1H3RVV1_9FIRM|nr:toprim domain-containing protein [Proteiniborus ethanoligenes]SDZ28989.1 DNA primase catalytic core, N-terminal domain [Proteiniborus ethanoligenes]
MASIYEIGYAPWDYTDFLISLVENSDITLEELIEFKLLGSKDTDNFTRTNVYCTLKNRITIPIIENGRIVGIIGRDIDENSISKYMKVGYTDYWNGILWQDGERLDGYLQGDILHIIEGQIDAITVKQCGIDNIWSVNGVHSLTPRVVEKIKKMSPDKIYIHLDWDSTGEKAETQWAEKLGHRCYIVPSLSGLTDNEGKEKRY